MTGKSYNRLVLAVSVFCAVVVLLGLYYRVHKPFGLAQALGLVQSGANLFVAGWLTWLAGGLGTKLLHRRDAEATPGERALLAASLGWGVIALLVLGLGMVHLYYWAIFWILALAASVWVRRAGVAWLRDLRNEIRAFRPGGRVEWLAAGCLALLFGLGFLRALAPPVMWDALVYHLTLPQRYVELGSVWLPLADFSLFSGMPQLSEMLYAAVMLLHSPLGDGGLIAAQVTGWVWGALLALGLATLAQRVGVSGLWAAVILFSSFTLAQSLAWAYADLLPALYTVAMLVSILCWRDRPARVWLVMAGVMGGLAWGGKYTGAIVPLAGAVMVAALGLEKSGRKGWKQTVWDAMLMMAVAAAIFAPWLVKNWFQTGSPTYPLGWPAADMDALRQWFFSRPDQAQRSFAGVLVLVRSVFLGLQGGNEFDATLNPLLIVLPIVLLISWVFVPQAFRQRQWPLLLFTGCGYAGWVALTYVSRLAVQPRLFFMVLPALALLAAAGLAAARVLDTRYLKFSWVLRVMALLVVVSGTFETTRHFIYQNPLPYLAGDQTAADYRFAQLGWYDVAMQRLGSLPEGARTVLLWEPRSLGCPASITCIPDVSIDRWWHSRRTVGTATAILDGWRSEGASYVLIYETGANFEAANSASPFEPSDWTELADLRRQLVWVSAAGPAYSLYAIP